MDISEKHGTPLLDRMFGKMYTIFTIKTEDPNMLTISGIL